MLFQKFRHYDRVDLLSLCHSQQTRVLHETVLGGHLSKSSGLIAKLVNVTAWVKSQPADRDPMHPDITGLEIVSVAMQPGDLLLFNSLLAHGVHPNRSAGRVRMAQYISMHPSDPDNRAERDERVRLWREQDFPKRAAYPGDPREWERRNAAVAEVTDLGERLLGLGVW